MLSTGRLADLGSPLLFAVLRQPFLGLGFTWRQQGNNRRTSPVIGLSDIAPMGASELALMEFPIIF
jgi:hypothetical protein